MLSVCACTSYKPCPGAPGGARTTYLTVRGAPGKPETMYIIVSGAPGSTYQGRRHAAEALYGEAAKRPSN